MICKAGTYVSVSSKGACDLEAHKQYSTVSFAEAYAAKGESSSGKITDYFVGPAKADDAVEGVCASHTYSYRSMACLTC